MPLQNLCDVHTHTLFSKHAYGTILENVHAAADTGLELLGSADHYSSMLFSDYRCSKNYQYLCCSKDWPRMVGDIMLLRAVEADIVDMDGHLFGEDIPVRESIGGDPLRGGEEKNLYDWTTGKLDYVVASIHGKSFTGGMSAAQITRMYIRALEHKNVLILGHIGRSALDIELDELLTAARDLHKLIEINEHTFFMKDAAESVDRCRHIAVRCAELGVSVSISTDAHFPLNVGHFERCLNMLEEIDFPQELIATENRVHFLKALKESGAAGPDLPDFSAQL